jgi:hypothetical protein
MSNVIADLNLSISMLPEGLKNHIPTPLVNFLRLIFTKVFPVNPSSGRAGIAFLDFSGFLVHSPPA